MLSLSKCHWNFTNWRRKIWLLFLFFPWNFQQTMIDFTFSSVFKLFSIQKKYFFIMLILKCSHSWMIGTKFSSSLCKFICECEYLKILLMIEKSVQKCLFVLHFSSTVWFYVECLFIQPKSLSWLISITSINK